MPGSADRREVAAVYAAALAQGVALVTFPAASSILTSAAYYGLSSTAYGALFLPQAAAAIAGALLGTRLTARFGTKQVFVAGLTADLVSMVLLFASQFLIGSGSLPYLVLLLATTSLGIGFGLTVPSLNRYAAGFFPTAVERAVLYLNALLGLGTALAPLFVALFVGLGFWSGLPLLVAVVLAILLVVCGTLPLRLGDEVERGGRPAPATARAGLPSRFWVFAAFALLYGIVETMSGTWSSLYMTGSLGATATRAAVALTAFWAMVTVGRIFFAAVEHRLKPAVTYRILPFVVVIAFVVVARLPYGSVTAGVLAFGLAGLGCSALLPLTIGFGQEELVTIPTFTAGGLIAAYQVGYGIAAFGVGPLQDAVHLSLAATFGLGAVVAAVLGVLSFAVVRSPRGHPRSAVSSAAGG
jgi:MFS family permease